MYYSNKIYHNNINNSIPSDGAMLTNKNSLVFVCNCLSNIAYDVRSHVSS